jgi:integrase
VVPITQRLRAVLEMRRTRPDGEEYGGEHYVFGDVTGKRITTIATAWRATCRRAGITGLTFHDLRRESGSRLLETPGISLLEVRDWLGHQNVSTTNTYLATTALKLQETARRFDLARKTGTNVTQTGKAQATNQAGNVVPSGGNSVN